MEKCFLSGKPVLDLSGQSSFFDSYLFNSKEEANKVVDKIGYCYDFHLVNSEWGVFWGELFLRNLVEVKGYQLHQEKDDLLSVRRIRSDGDVKTCVFRKSNGLTFFSSYLKHPTHEARSGGLFFPIRENLYTLWLNEFPDLALEVQETLDRNREYPIAKLANQLGVMEDMIFPEAIEDGKFEYDSELRSEWGPRTVTVRASYLYFVPDDVGELLLADKD